jgi:alpha-N-acetylglucosamine transferase
MHTIQSFLIVVLCAFVWLTIILVLAFAEEITIYDKDWKVKERIQDGTIYDRDWRVKGHIENGKVYDRDWNLEKRIEDGKIYDRKWNLKHRFNSERIFDRNGARRATYEKRNRKNAEGQWPLF